MPRLIEQALAEVAKLTEAEQEALGAWLLDELAAERRWDDAFAGSSDLLASLAEEALEEHRQRRTQPLEFS